MKKTLLYTLLVIYTLTGCSDDSIDVYYYVYADSYVKTKTINGVDKYAPVFVSNSNYRIDSAYVTDSENKKTKLAHYWAYPNYQRYMPVEDDYTEQIPEETLYNFVVKLNRIDSVKLTDTLHSIALNGINIVDCIHSDNTDQTITIKWNKIDNVDSYIVKVVKEENSTPLYYSAPIELDTIHTFTINSEKWNNPQIFNTLTSFNVEILGVKYGKKTNGAINTNDVQALSSAYKTLNKNAVE